MSLWIAGLAPALEDPVAAEGESAAPVELEAPVEAEPAPVTGSVVITVVGAIDSVALAAAVEARLAPLGIVPSFETARALSPRMGHAPADRIAEIWIVESAWELRVVIADPEHVHTVVRTLALEEPSQAVRFEALAALVEDGVAMAAAGTWPEPEPLPEVTVEPPVPPPEPVVPVAKPRRPARGRFLRGFLVGTSAGVSVARDEFDDLGVGVPALLRLGYLFGDNRKRPDLRASIEARVGSMTVYGTRTDLSLVQFMVESRIGFTRGPVWMFGIVGVGTGVYSRHRQGEAFRDVNGVMGTLGAGVAVRVSRYLALHFDAVASGMPGLVRRLGGDLGLTFYIDPRRGERAR